MSGMIKWMTRPLTALAIAAGSILASAGATQAYEKADCDRMFGSANVSKVQFFRADGGGADFGDELHLFGAPKGDAVICWSIDGRVAVKGKLYADVLCPPLRPCDHVDAKVEIRFQRTNGHVTNITRRTVSTFGGVVSGEVEKVSPLGNFNRVRIQLFELLHTGIAGRDFKLTKTLTFHR